MSQQSDPRIGALNSDLPSWAGLRAPLLAPVSQLHQLRRKRTPLKAPIDLHPIIVREEQKLTSRPCRDQGVPTEQKSKLDRAGQMRCFVGFELMSGCVV